MANGGISSAMLNERFSEHLDGNEAPKQTDEDKAVAGLFRRTFTLNDTESENPYHWSIACALQNGFSSVCERRTENIANGITRWIGRYPLAAIAYPSVRDEQQSLNYAFNNLGRTHVSLHNIQWIETRTTGESTGLDFADSWLPDGTIEWKSRPARLTLGEGQSAKLRCVEKNVWVLETEDGSLPLYT